MPVELSELEKEKLAEYLVRNVLPAHLTALMKFVTNLSNDGTNQEAQNILKPVKIGRGLDKLKPRL